MNYGDLISRAWNIFWKQKVLWLFYIVCMLPIYVYSFASSFITPIGENFSPGFFMIGLALVVSIISMLVTTFAQTGIIRGIYSSYKDSLQILTFRDIYDEVLPRYGKVLGFLFLYYLGVVALIGFMVFGLGGLAALGAAQESPLSILLILCWCLLIPLFIIIGFIFTQTLIALVVDDLSIWDATKRGWEVFRKNLGEVLMINLIIFGISLGVGIVILIPAMCVMGAYMQELVASGAYPATVAGQTPWYYSLVSLVYSLLSTIFGIYLTAIYVLFYLEITKRPGWKKNKEVPEAIDEQESL